MKIEAADDYERSLRRLARHWLRRIDRNAKKAGQGQVDAVHDMRTGVRRLRTLLKLAEGKRAHCLHKQAKRIGTSLGAVRDLDVALEHVRASVSRGELFLDEAVQAWVEAIERERATALKALRRDLKGPYGAWRRRVRAWTKGGKPGRSVHEALPAALASFQQESEDLLPPVDEPSRHELRKAIKRLRYVFEFYEEALPSEAKDVAERLTNAQDALGEHRDRLTLADRAVREATSVATRGDDSRELESYVRRLREGIQHDDAIKVAQKALTASHQLVGTLGA